MTRYGYIPPNALVRGNPTLPLKKFQKTFGLKETGIADAATLALMKTPRCGNRDDLSYRDKAWYKKELTYYFHNYTPDLSQAAIRSLTQRAFRYWSDIAKLSFYERRNGDIVIAYV